jgi:hypothetical protein
MVEREPATTLATAFSGNDAVATDWAAGRTRLRYERRHG